MFKMQTIDLCNPDLFREEDKQEDESTIVSLGPITKNAKVSDTY